LGVGEFAGGGGFGGGGGNGTSGQWGGSGGFGGGGGGSNDLARAGNGGFGGGGISGTSAGGGGAGMGGAIFNHRGRLNLTNVTMTGNTAAGGRQYSSPDNGTAGPSPGSGLGAAIFNLNGAVTIRYSTLANNTVRYSKGGAPSGGLGDATVYSVAYGNRIEDGSSSLATLTIEGSIIAGNLGSDGAGNHDVVNNVVAGTHPDNTGNTATLTYLGSNLIGASESAVSSAGATATQNGAPTSSADPLLGALADNGGPSFTLQPAMASPAIDATACTGAAATDQRGAARPDPDNASATPCDLGAVEVGSGFALSVSVSGNGQVDGDAMSGPVACRASSGDCTGHVPMGSGPGTNHQRRSHARHRRVLRAMGRRLQRQRVAARRAHGSRPQLQREFRTNHLCHQHQRDARRQRHGDVYAESSAARRQRDLHRCTRQRLRLRQLERRLHRHGHLHPEQRHRDALGHGELRSWFAHHHQRVTDEQRHGDLHAQPGAERRQFDLRGHARQRLPVRRLEWRVQRQRRLRTEQRHRGSIRGCELRIRPRHLRQRLRGKLSAPEVRVRQSRRSATCQPPPSCVERKPQATAFLPLVDGGEVGPRGPGCDDFQGGSGAPAAGDHRRARQDARRRAGRSGARAGSGRVRLRHSASAEGRIHRERGHRHRCLVLRQPLGVVAGITPFNFPAMVPMWMFPVALACGNTFILKPSERDPSASLLLAELLAEAGLPAGRVQRGARRQGGGRRAAGASGRARVSFVGSTPIANTSTHRAAARQARAGAGRRQEPHGGDAGCRSGPGRRCADGRGLRLGRRALHGDLGGGRRWATRPPTR
jgi:hypothetical protein